MSRETERRVGNLLSSSQRAAPAIDSAASGQGDRQPSNGLKITKPVSTLESSSAKEKLSIELKQRQDKLMVDWLSL